MQSPSVSSCIHWFRYHVQNIWNQQEFQKLINQDQVIGKCAQAFSSQKQTQESIASYGNVAMLNVFSSNNTSLRYSLVYCAPKFQKQRVLSQLKDYHQLRQLANSTPCKLVFKLCSGWVWIIKWIRVIGGWKIQDDNILLPSKTNKASASEKLLQKIHCNCSGECTSRKCTCRKNGMNVLVCVANVRVATTRTFQKTPLQNMMVNRMSIINMLFLNN